VAKESKQTKDQKRTMSVYRRKFVWAVALLISLLISGGPFQPIASAAAKTHIFKIYIDPSLVSDIQFAKQVLPKYVQDMNAVLAKNTNRELIFDPDTGIIPTATQPHTGSAGVLPTTDFEI